MRITFSVFFLFSASLLFGQMIEDLVIQIDSSSYRFSDNTRSIYGEDHMLFEYSEEFPVVQVTLQISPEAKGLAIDLLPSTDFEVLDSLERFGDLARFKVRFNGLSNSEFLRFSFRESDGDFVRLEEFPLLPFQITYATIYPGTEELFIGEEKVFELVTNNVDNLVLDYRWQKGKVFNYRFSQSGQQTFLHLIPSVLGNHTLNLPIALRKPYLDFYDSLQYVIEPLRYDFSVKEGRLVFLALDKQEITPNDDKTEPLTIQIDNHPRLQLGRTYRIENQEQPGGPLIAEFFTKTRLNNDKVLADLRIYALHRKSEGYLYIKDGDQAKFVTNVDITPKTRITSIEVQREGASWTSSATVYPGEELTVRLKGEGLHKSRISFQGVSDLVYDSLVRNENLSLFKIQIPKDVSTKNIEIFNYNQSTGQSLRVQEYQRARPMDFVTLDLAGETFVLSEIDKPIYFDRTLTDLVIDFDRSQIDSETDFYGLQYLTIDVKVSNKQGNLLEIYRFDELVIAPGESSPRHINYDLSNETTGAFNLNNYLSKKTHSLEEWSRIDLEIKHIKEKHGGKGESKRVQIYLKRDYNFDVDLSFPAGLLILEAGSDQFENFAGPSFAMIAQFSFYQPGKIAKYRPFKFGAGFIALDAFNLNGNGDIGLVAIGSLHPTTSGKRLTFPLYTGFGYSLTKGVPFFLVGPGIRVRL